MSAEIFDIRAMGSMWKGPVSSIAKGDSTHRHVLPDTLIKILLSVTVKNHYT